MWEVFVVNSPAVTKDDTKQNMMKSNHNASSESVQVPGMAAINKSVTSVVNSFLSS